MDKEETKVMFGFFAIIIVILTLMFKLIDYKKYEWDKIQEIVNSAAEQNIPVEIK